MVKGEAAAPLVKRDVAVPLAKSGLRTFHFSRFT
jgi:hypothetical protein